MTQTTMADNNPISHIFHEKQEGSLCAQHCLNALLQGNYFTAVDLADIGRSLDEAERQQMAEAGTQSDEYMRFMQQPSSNYDDSGFFSIQVIQKAVSVWSLELLPFTSSSPEAILARDDPRTQYAYICNFREHWFTIRKLGHQWFNLNSLLTCPELVSDTYLSLLLTQLQQEGYAIFVVLGSLPECEADQILKLIRADQPTKPRLLTDKVAKGTTQGEGSHYDDPELLQALEESKRLAEEDDQSLKRALAMSMEGLPADYAFPSATQFQPSFSNIQETGTSHTSAEETSRETSGPTAEELRDKRLAFFQNKSSDQPTSAESSGSNEGSSSSSSKPKENPGQAISNKTSSETKDASQTTDISEYSEEKMLELALKMSMEGDT